VRYGVRGGKNGGGGEEILFNLRMKIKIWGKNKNP
jgi:hypothetical protein